MRIIGYSFGFTSTSGIGELFYRLPQNIFIDAVLRSDFFYLYPPVNVTPFNVTLISQTKFSDALPSPTKFSDAIPSQTNFNDALPSPTKFSDVLYSPTKFSATLTSRKIPPVRFCHNKEYTFHKVCLIIKFVYINIKYVYINIKYVYINIKYVYINITYVYINIKYVYINIKYVYINIKYLYINIKYVYINIKYVYILDSVYIESTLPTEFNIYPTWVILPSFADPYSTSTSGSFTCEI